jgi:tRNA(fMet)-specific endonuclease VapC
MLTALDTDVFTEVLHGNTAFVARLLQIPIAEQSLPIVVVEEMIRGRFNVIRQAEAGKGRVSLEEAYARFQQSVTDTRTYTILPFTKPAEALVASWRKQKIRVGTSDMRIAAICIVNGATLVTRNARDYTQLPGLTLDVWN